MKHEPLAKIQFRDPQVKAMWDFYNMGMCTYDEVKKAMHTLENDRINFLMEKGMSQDEAIDEAVDSVWAIDNKEFDSQWEEIRKRIEYPF